MAEIRFTSLDTLAKSFASVFFSVKLRVWEHNISCALDISSYSEFKEKHVES